MANDGPKIYTKTGDQGQSSLIGGKRVSKAHLRLDAYGELDELNSCIGVLRSCLDIQQHFKFDNTKKQELFSNGLVILAHIQSALFDLGSHLACEDENLRAKLPKLDMSLVVEMETWIDQAQLELEPLKNFILPGGDFSASMAHLARSITRRAERHIVRLSEKENLNTEIIIWMNRLSDFLFVWARFLNLLSCKPDIPWIAKKSF